MRNFGFYHTRQVNFLIVPVIALLAFQIFGPVSSFSSAASSFTYKDVPSRHWARPSVEFLNKNRIFPAKKYFKGTKKALRYDIFLSTDKLLDFFEAYKGVKIKKKTSFPDMPSSRDAKKSILRLSGLGFVKGGAKGRLEGMKNVTRYEAAVFFNRIITYFKLKPLKKRPASFSDLPSRHWAAASVKNLTRFSVINGYRDSTFKGKGNISRYELAVILKKMGHLFFSKNVKIVRNSKTPQKQAKHTGKDTLPWISRDKLFKLVNRCVKEKRKYKYGSWDCSRFVQYTFETQGVKLPRKSSDQGKTGRPVEIADLRPGDLLFFNYKDNTDKITHSAVYLGKYNRIQCAFAHNSWSEKRVIVTDLAKEYYLSKLICARRVALLK